MKPETIPGLRRSHVPSQGARDALVSSVSAMVDSSLMRAVNLLVERRLLPRDVDLEYLRESVRAMLATDLVDNPGRLFDFVPDLESRQECDSERLLTRYRKRIGGGTRYGRSLASAYRSAAVLPEDTGARDTIRFEHWIHDGGADRATIIILHGFAMGWPLIDARAMCAPQWFDSGLNVVLLTLPDHGARRPRGSVFSGQSFTVPHAVFLAGAVRRAVYEIFEMKSWLRQRGSGAVGLLGVSLGGYLTALCAGLSRDFDFLVPVVPPACMGDLAWRVYRETTHNKNGGDPELNEESMRAAFYPHSPLAHACRTDRERLFIVAGAGDRIVPPEHPSALWEHWGEPGIHWLRGSHMAPFANTGLIRLLVQHLRDLGVAD